MGIGLAQVCSYYGVRFICVVDSKTTLQNILILKAYGAEVDIVDVPDAVTGEFLQARINRVHNLQDSMENTYWPNQYSNKFNPIAHHKTMHEIVAALGDIDYLFCATSTCGTLRGCAEYVRWHNLKTKIVAVDALGSVLFGGKSGKRLIPGHGAAIIPPLFQAGLAYSHLHVSDLDSIVGCRRLANREAILSGGSSGAVLMAVERLKNDIPADAVCVVILADRGDRYLDTIFSNIWVREHFGDVSHLWEVSLEPSACVMATY
jgi:cysteine synthase A